jgi:hypothetical protein
MDLMRVLLGESEVLGFNSEIRMVIDLAEKCVGKVCLCKPFRKSEVIWRGSISENRISIGFGCGFGDLDFGCGKVLWISGYMVGICWGVGLWKSW